MPITKTITLKDIERKLSGFNAYERETSILFDHFDGLVYIETSKPDVARRLFPITKHPEIEIDEHLETFGIVIPERFVRAPELILKPKLRIL